MWSAGVDVLLLLLLADEWGIFKNLRFDFCLYQSYTYIGTPYNT